MKDAECYIVGIDISNDPDLATLVVVKREGKVVKTVNTYTGEEALEKYRLFNEMFVSSRG